MASRREQSANQAAHGNSLSRVFSFEEIASPEYHYDPVSAPELDEFIVWPDSRQSTLDSVKSQTTQSTTSLQLAHESMLAQSLPSPQLTHTSTPEAMAHGNLSISPSMATSHSRPITPLALQTNLQISNRNGAYQAISPVEIRISSHSRGDSPARTQLPLSRNGSVHGKRTRPTNDDYFVPDHVPQSPSLLSPPADLEDDFDDETTERAGVVPDKRGPEEVPNFRERDEQTTSDARNEDITGWLSQMDINGINARLARAKSTSAQNKSLSTSLRPPAHVPGPGIMLDEDDEPSDSDDDYDGVDWPDENDEQLVEHRVVTSPVTIAPEYIHPPEPPKVDRPHRPVPQQPEASQEEVLPTKFFRQAPWQDAAPALKPDDDGIRHQPATSNDALYEFTKRAQQWDNVSRAATWGTGRRRLSDTDSMISDKQRRHLSLSQKTREHSQQIFTRFEQAKQSIKRRTSSHNKKASVSSVHNEIEKVASPEPIEENPLDRPPQKHSNSMSSLHRRKSPSHSHHNSTTSIPEIAQFSEHMIPEDQQESFITRVIRRVRSNSNVPKTPRSPHALHSLLAGQGGVPVPTLASPMHPYEQDVSAGHSTPPTIAAPTQDVLHLKMNLEPQSINIVPTFEGFKAEIARLNPRLEPYLLERLAHDQVKRYKRLIRVKVDHTQQVSNSSCPSQHLCSAHGVVVEQLPSKYDIRDSAQTALVAVGNADSEPDESSFDGNVSSGLFPPGIPLPLAKKLPARFECELCNTVKSFQKPSDWTKHVHEDVQPFTCTFRDCRDPKSFKRKADWVRHENERHRKLEGWRCNVQSCTHECYRKDNFVQHLVREHKMKEPKNKTKTNMSSKARARLPVTAQFDEEARFWDVVEQCHRDLQKEARMEPCKFCQNPLPTWKKLSVHVGKHMEQIAMPIIDLVKERTVDKNTIISPVEPLTSGTQQFVHENTMNNDTTIPTPSPYSNSVASNYASSSVDNSPALAMLRTRSMGPSQPYLGTTPDQTFGMTAADMQGIFVPQAAHGGYLQLHAPLYAYQPRPPVTDFPTSEAHTNNMYRMTQHNIYPVAADSMFGPGQMQLSEGQIYGHQTDLQAQYINQSYAGYPAGSTAYSNPNGHQLMQGAELHLPNSYQDFDDPDQIRQDGNGIFHSSIQNPHNSNPNGYY